VISTQCTKVSVEDIPFSAVALYGENQHVLIKIYYTNLRQADSQQDTRHKLAVCTVQEHHKHETTQDICLCYFQRNLY